MEQQRPADGCLVGVVRAVALVVVVPLRLLWEALAFVLRPVGVVLDWLWWLLGKVLYGLLIWPLLMLERYVLAPIGRALARLGAWLLIPLRWAWPYLRAVLVALGRGCAWLFRYLVAVPLTALYEYVLAPIGRAVRWALEVSGVVVAWLARYLLVIPLSWLWRAALRPVLLGLLWAWRLGGRVWRFTVLRPCRWFHRQVWLPVKLEVREILRTVRRALLG